MPGLIFFLAGLLAGSFLNAAAYRLPHHISLVRPASHCPRCRRRLRAWENLPLISFLFQLGRCRGCRVRIPLRYPLLEAACGGVFLLAYCRLRLAPAVIEVCVLLAFLLALIATDAEYQQLPDELTLGGLALALAWSWWRGPAHSAGMAGFTQASLGALLGAALPAAAGWLYRLWRGREGLGQGDIKLMAMIGAFLGAGGALLTLALASAAGALAGLALMLTVFLRRLRRARRRGFNWTASRERARASADAFFRRLPLPIGVLLAGMAVVNWLWGHRLWNWYWHGLAGR